MNERIYFTPRTHGSPTGYDREMTHLPNWRARMAEQLALALVSGSGGGTLSWGPELAGAACDIADAMVNEYERRGWLLKVEDAPGMDRDYGAKRGSAEPDGVALPDGAKRDA